MFDTVQDAGRYGYQHLGINPGGAMDRHAASLANALLGKTLNSPVIELHFPAAVMRFEQACVVCLAGADFSPLVDDLPVPLHQPFVVAAGSVLQFKAVRNGARCYLAVLNELLLPKWLNSYSTNLKVGAGGYQGRRLVKGDELRFAPLQNLKLNEAVTTLPWRYSEGMDSANEVEFIPGNEWNWLNTKSQTVFLNEAFTITPASDRMGYRLQGEVLIPEKNDSLVSSAVCFGTVQLLPNGQLIVLMADHQTTGGYPRIGHVISAHLPRLAQKKPGDKINFVLTNLAAAEEKRVQQQTSLQHLQNTCALNLQNWLHAHRH